MRGNFSPVSFPRLDNTSLKQNASKVLDNPKEKQDNNIQDNKKLG